MPDMYDIYGEIIDDFDYIDPPVAEAVQKLPPEVGGWVLHNGSNRIIFPMYKKPRWFTRFMMNLCFEIKWEDS